MPYLPGVAPPRERPLGRFLPPLYAGAVQNLVAREGLADGPVLDPFGSAPEMAVEAAEAGCAVVVAANNPVTRFVLERHLDPLSVEELQTALARLSTAEKDGRRLEPFLLDLYETMCRQCGEVVHAEYFTWDVETERPVGTAYRCPHCNHAGEEPADELDRENAREFEKRGLPHALALERVAPVDDPYRPQAEAALEIYPGRALYALVTLVNKLSQLKLEGREAVAVHALMLSAFDAADSMWAHPEGRVRPKQLSPSPRFREANLWRALERGVEAWAQEDRGVGIRWWPESGGPEPGSVSIFAGPARELAQSLPPTFTGCLLTVPPRPNQAYWTLSALWAAWLWGREVAQPVRAALQRRRYDWGWHASALRKSFRHLVAVLPGDTSLLLLVPEAEPGFLGACLAGFDAAELRLKGICLRGDDRQAQLRWHLSTGEGRAGSWSEVEGSLGTWLVDQLEALGQPSPYSSLHAAAATRAASQIGFGALWRAEAEPPVSGLQRRVEEKLADRRLFVRLDQRQDPETGVYWLTDPGGGAVPLADRTERVVLQAFRRRSSWDLLELDGHVCRQLPGLLTPDRTLVHACVASYAEEGEDGNWTIRSEDETAARLEDVAAIREDLATLGERLGFETAGQDPIYWMRDGEPAFGFCVLETAILGDAPELEEGQLDPTFVIPGGRAGLLTEKARRDPRLERRLEAGLQVVKFRHIRRLLSDTTLTPQNLPDRLALDPPEHQESQLPLL